MSLPDKLVAVVRTVAPALATALGGPLAGVATKVLAGVLLGNDDASESDVAAALQGATPADLLKLKQAEQEFTLRMREADIDLERIAVQDRASARSREAATGDVWTPRIMATLIVGGFLWAVWYVLTGRAHGLTDPAVVGIVGTLIGYVSAKADQVVGYYFGSSADSRRKTIAMADAMQNAAQTRDKGAP